MNISFNKPYTSARELEFIADAVNSGELSGNGKYTQLCAAFLEKCYGFDKVLLTHSCTAALEMAAILCEVQSGDEVIVPSFTFPSTANAFLLRGATLIFADSTALNPNIAVETIEPLITKKTKVIVTMHYAGIACDMEPIMELANKYNITVVEDAAQAIDSFYIGSNGDKKPLGGFGHLAAFSFHQTKNITAGEAGMLVINDSKFAERAENILQNGTNRAAFSRGEVSKYHWVDMGSSFFPSELTAAFLYGQLLELEEIQKTRCAIWNQYNNSLAQIKTSKVLQLQELPSYSIPNGHIFYLICKNQEIRDSLINYLRRFHIQAQFHYLSLHASPFFSWQYSGKDLLHANTYSRNLIRLPIHNYLDVNSVNRVCQSVKSFLKEAQ